jgi:hypothetical protein
MVAEDFTEYVVSLEGKMGNKARYVRWRNTVSEIGLADFICKLGSFHLFGSTKLINTHLHAIISGMNMPIVTEVKKYGSMVHNKKNLIVFPDGVIDMGTKTLYPKNVAHNIYHLGGTDGIYIHQPDYEKYVPKIGAGSLTTYSEVLDIISPLYQKSFLHFPIMVACYYSYIA